MTNEINRVADEVAAPSLYGESSAALHITSQFGILGESKESQRSGAGYYSLGVLARNWRHIFIGALFCGLLFVLHAIVMPKTYTAHTVLYLAQPKLQTSATDVVSADLNWKHYLNTQLNRLNRGEFLPTTLRPGVSSEQTMNQHTFNAETKDSLNYIAVQATAADPELAANLLRLQAEEFVNKVVEEQREFVTQLNQRFGEQLAFLSAKMLQSKNADIKLGQQTPAIQSAARISTTADSGLGRELDQLKEQYRLYSKEFGPKHPKMRELQEKIDALESRLHANDGISATVEVSPVAEILSPREQAFSDVQKELLSQQATAMSAALSLGASVRVVEPAFPPLEANELSASAKAIVGTVLGFALMWALFALMQVLQNNHTKKYPLPRSVLMRRQVFSSEALPIGWFLPAMEPKSSEDECAANA